MTRKAPGKSHREGITLIQLARKFPDEGSARQWFENTLWPDGTRYCPECASINTYECKHAKMPYRCRDCGKYFSVKTGSVMAGSPVPLLKWLYAIYLDVTSLKGVSSMKLHREIGVTQKTAWFMQQRIREAFTALGPDILFGGPVEVDETYMGGIRGNMSNKKRKELSGTGRGGKGKAIVAGAKDRATNKVSARVVKGNDARTLEIFINERAYKTATVYTDEHGAYASLKNDHETVTHSAGEYVKKGTKVHTQGIESFWAMLKRAHKGTFHKLSPKHLDRYVQEFSGRHNIRDLDTMDQMQSLASGMRHKRLTYSRLTAHMGVSNAARPCLRAYE